MNNYRNLSMSIITEPYQSLSNRGQLKINSNFSVQKNRKVSKDFSDAIQLANFIGLEPLNRVKRRKSSKVQTFFKTHNLSMTEQKSRNSQKIIKNQITNRQINFFDFQNILSLKKKRLIFQKANHSNINSSKLLTSQNINQKRAHSQRFFRYKGSSQKNYIYAEKIKTPQNNKLKIQIARQIEKKQKQRIKRNIQIQNHLQKMNLSLLNRSKILKQTFEANIFQNPQISPILEVHSLFKSKFKISKKIMSYS